MEIRVTIKGRNRGAIGMFWSVVDKTFTVSEKPNVKIMEAMLFSRYSEEFEITEINIGEVTK